VDKKELLRRLNETYQQSLDTLASADPTQVVYEEYGWRVKDIVAHVATWDGESLRSLHAFRRNVEYSIPNFTDVDDFNGYAATARMDEPFEQILEDWDATIKWMRIIINAMTPENLADEMTHPSGKRGGVGELIAEIIEHQAGHMNDIRAALVKPQ
jgi:hypothetical protein